MDIIYTLRDNTSGLFGKRVENKQTSVYHLMLRRFAQHVRVHSHRSTLSTLPSANAISQLEKDGARILRAVQKRVETRKECLSKASRARKRCLVTTDPLQKNRCRKGCRLPKTLRARVTSRSWSLCTMLGCHGRKRERFVLIFFSNYSRILLCVHKRPQ